MGVVYDFGYYSNVEGTAVIYVEGERNMQDSIAVGLASLRKAPEKPLVCTCCPVHHAWLG